MCVVVAMFSSVFRIGREETIACLLLWKIEKNLYFFFALPRGGQHNIILTHFYSPKKKVFFLQPDFGLWKLLFPHNNFFLCSPFSILKVLTVETRKIRRHSSSEREINNFSFLCVKWKFMKGLWTVKKVKRDFLYVLRNN